MFTLVIGVMIGQEDDMPLVRPIVINGFAKLKNMLTMVPREDDREKTTFTEIVKNTIQWCESFGKREKND